jgi:hypothetical protein
MTNLLFADLTRKNCLGETIPRYQAYYGAITLEATSVYMLIVYVIRFITNNVIERL